MGDVRTSIEYIGIFTPKRSPVLFSPSTVTAENNNKDQEQTKQDNSDMVDQLAWPGEMELQLRSITYRYS